MFITRSSRVLSSRHVAYNQLVSCRSRSVFAATTRGASQNLKQTISCACSKVCSCELHKYTQADSEIMNFLKKEIDNEKKAASKVPPSDLFQSKVDGMLVKLEREYNAERIVVSFDLNENTNQDESAVDEDAEEDQQYAENDHEIMGKIVSYPYFTVEITKQPGKTLKFYCEFNSELGENFSDHEEENEEIINIINVSVLDSSDKDKTVYCSETENLDSNLYMMLLNMLAERGIDRSFCQWLLEYSTALEQQHYVRFLEDLQGFVKLQ